MNSPATLGTVPAALVIGISGAAVFASMSLYASLKHTLQSQERLTPQKASFLLIRHVLICCSAIAAAVGVLSQASLVATIATALGAGLLIWGAIELLVTRRGAKLSVLTQVSRDGLALEFAPAELRNDYAIVLAAVQQNGLALEFASDELRNDHAIVLAAVQQNGWALEFASDELRNDHTIVLAAAQCSNRWLQRNLRRYHGHINSDLQVENWPLKYASRSFLNNRQIMLAAVREDCGALQFTSQELKNDKEVVLAAVQQWGGALQWASERLRGDPEVVMEAVQRPFLRFEWETGFCERVAFPLEWAFRELQNNREIVLAAVQQNGWALEHGSAELRNDREIVLAAVQQYSGALRLASAELRNDREFVLAAVQQKGRVLRFASTELRNDREIVLAAVWQNGEALQFASEALRADRRFAREVRLPARMDPRVGEVRAELQTRWTLGDRALSESGGAFLMQGSAPPSQANVAEAQNNLIRALGLYYPPDAQRDRAIEALRGPITRLEISAPLVEASRLIREIESNSQQAGRQLDENERSRILYGLTALVTGFQECTGAWVAHLPQVVDGLRGDALTDENWILRQLAQTRLSIIQHYYRSEDQQVHLTNQLTYMLWNLHRIALPGADTIEQDWLVGQHDHNLDLDVLHQGLLARHQPEDLILLVRDNLNLASNQARCLSLQGALRAYLAQQQEIQAPLSAQLLRILQSALTIPLSAPLRFLQSALTISLMAPLRFLQSIRRIEPAAGQSPSDRVQSLQNQIQQLLDHQERLIPFGQSLNDLMAFLANPRIDAARLGQAVANVLGHAPTQRLQELLSAPLPLAGSEERRNLISHLRGILFQARIRQPEYPSLENSLQDLRTRLRDAEIAAELIAASGIPQAQEAACLQQFDTIQSRLREQEFPSLSSLWRTAAIGSRPRIAEAFRDFCARDCTALCNLLLTPLVQQHVTEQVGELFPNDQASTEGVARILEMVGVFRRQDPANN